MSSKKGCTTNAKYLGVSKNKTVEGKQKLYENEYDPY